MQLETNYCSGHVYPKLHDRLLHYCIIHLHSVVIYLLIDFQIHPPIFFEATLGYSSEKGNRWSRFDTPEMPDLYEASIIWKRPEKTQENSRKQVRVSTVLSGKIITALNLSLLKNEPFRNFQPSTKWTSTDAYQSRIMTINKYPIVRLEKK